jgi:glutathione S-transferase
MTITVHYLADSRAQRILWLLEELELPYEIKRYERLPRGLGSPELYHVHSLGMSPILTDGDLTLAELGRLWNTSSQNTAGEN